MESDIGHRESGFIFVFALLPSSLSFSLPQPRSSSPADCILFCEDKKFFELAVRQYICFTLPCSLLLSGLGYVPALCCLRRRCLRTFRPFKFFFPYILLSFSNTNTQAHTQTGKQHRSYTPLFCFLLSIHIHTNKVPVVRQRSCCVFLLLLTLLLALSPFEVFSVFVFFFLLLARTLYIKQSSLR